MHASHSIIGAYTKEEFHFAMTQFIIPLVGSVANREPHSVVIMDNCRIHDSDDTIEAIRRKGAIVMFLP